ncbi:hypothetical protein [Nocardia africana]|uniref:Low molecular weight antigen MTB12-like C-terminal domain-containing protein n=1 Tax=Nocardia africana TaxID=134964 RepID=A0A378X2K4_9NOCA|nr:hypothetical protein [Nocardia africana]MCC3316953.1 hypothetical protein [Nocardia africana]SUA47679.1 Uncharacterised protein [Nocardia africana]
MMFDRAIVAKMLAACALTALVTAACGSNDSGGKSAETSSSGTPTVTQAVSRNFERFFDGSTSADQKVALLENGPAFAAAIKAQADSPMAKSASAKVTNVASTSTDHADVTFDVLFNGAPALSGQQGGAVRIEGTWKVTAATFCALLTLEGAAPPVCGAASATPAPGASPAPGATTAAPGGPTIVPAPTS